MSIQDYLKSKTDLLEKHLDHLIPEKDEPHKELYRAARYSLMGAGKRLRPILVLATTETMGGDVNKALSAACALEMIHTYSLIHDDLPCMDNADFRRGKPALHKAFRESHAVLAGDFLLTYAFEVLASDKNLNSTQKLMLIELLAKNAGSKGMIAGQIMDLEAEGKKINLECLRLIHRNKTGALITASIEFGGIIANCSSFHMNILRNFSEHIGLAFQIVDDILDATESRQNLGKDSASDLKNDKATYVALMGLEESKRLAQELYQFALDELKKLPANAGLLASLAELVVKRQN